MKRVLGLLGSAWTWHFPQCTPWQAYCSRPHKIHTVYDTSWAKFPVGLFHGVMTVHLWECLCSLGAARLQWEPRGHHRQMWSIMGFTCTGQLRCKHPQPELGPKGDGCSIKLIRVNQTGFFMVVNFAFGST